MTEENIDKPQIVSLILNKDTERALNLLAEHYNVAAPKLRVGLPKGHRRVYGCYTSKNQTISVLDSNMLSNPFVILHEFYHHLRSKAVDRQHRGTEKNANKFAKEFLVAHQAAERHSSDQPFSAF